MSCALNCLALSLGLLGSLVAAGSVTELKDAGELTKFLDKQNVALVEFFDEKDGHPEDLEAAAKALGDAVAVGRVPGSEKVNEKFEVTSLPTIKFFAKGKAHGEDYDGDRDSETSQADLVEYAKQTLNDAKDKGVVKDPDEVEELKSSRKDRLCFTAEGLCAIYLSNGKATKDELALLARLKKKHTSKLSTGANARGTTWNWSWLDASAEPSFKALLAEDAGLPGMVLYNPHKRPRHVTLAEGVEATEESIDQLVDKVLAGDARFTPAKGQKLPTFAGKQAEKEL